MSEADATAFGLTVEEASGPPTEVWPDSVAAANVFICMSTQWRVAMGGATGLDYNALPNVMRLIGVPRMIYQEIFEDIRVMEDAALETMREDKK